jgi:hypothetical protein
VWRIGLLEAPKTASVESPQGQKNAKSGHAGDHLSLDW